MSITYILFAALFASLAVSYGWGMRGCIIGGEKGAMLPGAILGLLLAWFSGSEIIRENFYIFAAVGALSMFHGGTETYAQTMRMILMKGTSEYKPRKGCVALGLKGFLWFGLCGGFLGMSFTAVSGSVYRVWDFIILFALLPFIQFLGTVIFNKPFDPENNKFPKIYFSYTRREEWGGNALLVIVLLVLMIIRGDSFGIYMLICGGLSGAVGWIIGIYLMYYTGNPINKKNYLGALQRRGFVDSWKNMEFALGAVGGFGIMLSFLLRQNTINKISDAIENNGGIWTPIGKYEPMLSWILISLFILTAIQYIFVYLKERKFESLLNKDMHIYEIIERPFYSALPLMLIFLGSKNMAQLMSFFAIYYVLAEKNIFEEYVKLKHVNIWRAFFVLIGALINFGQIVGEGYTLWQTWLLYMIPYVVSQLIYFFRISEFKRKMSEYNNKFGNALRSYKAGLTVNLFFVVQIIILTTVGYFAFFKL